MSQKIIKIGLDLDGVLVDKPPLIPKLALEWLVRDHAHKRLAYRYPQWPLERWLRWLTHQPLFRPPIRQNLELVKKLGKDSSYQLYLVSGRYAFLKGRTKQWLVRHRLTDSFDGIFLNLDDDQPHLFKREKIKELKLDVFIDDDPPLCLYLQKELPQVEIFCFEKGRPVTLASVAKL